MRLIFKVKFQNQENVKSIRIKRRHHHVNQASKRLF